MSKANVNTYTLQRPKIDISKNISDGKDLCKAYIELLCERYKNRGVTSRIKHDATLQEEKHSACVLNLPFVYRNEKMHVSPYDSRFRTGKYKGATYMTSDDFANYYRELRDYRTPRNTSRTDEEYAEIERRAEEKQKLIDAGTRSKKAKWLALTHVLKARLTAIRSHLNREEYKRLSSEWFPADLEEDRREGKVKKMPRGVIPSFCVVAVSLLMIVASTVMVSRAEMEISSLENQISDYKQEKKELDVDIELKSDMIRIKEWAMQNGMVSGEYINSKFVDIEDEEKIESFEEEKNDSAIKKFLAAIGILNND